MVVDASTLSWLQPYRSRKFEVLKSEVESAHAITRMAPYACESVQTNEIFHVKPTQVVY